MSIDSPTGSIVVLGLGNPLMADDGIGIAALERLEARGTGSGVDLVDGGTWGMSLLPVIENAGKLLVLDAITCDREPGTLIVLERNEIPRYLSTKVSPHQVALHDLLALAELRGRLPEHTVAIGLQPARVEMSPDGLSAPVLAQMDLLVDAVMERLAAWRSLSQSPVTSRA